MRTTWELFDSWRGDEIVADQESGVFLADPEPGRFSHHDLHFDIEGQFNVPRSPQGRPVIFQAGDSEEGREFAASSADAIFSRHGTLEDGQKFYADVKGRLARYGRTPDQLKILPAATFVLGDTDDEAREIARQVRYQQVSGPTAIMFAEQLWNRDLSGYDPDGPLPDAARCGPTWDWIRYPPERPAPRRWPREPHAAGRPRPGADQHRVIGSRSPAQQHRPGPAGRTARLHPVLVRRAPPQPRTALSTVEEFGPFDALYPGRLDLGLGRSGGRPPAARVARPRPARPTGPATGC
jgi:alkanesulfonate monooxygenase SsuD/methylene tetrahydromethanopterin reductase-like flavin-dependent oxidoreductase (luciferase family)